MKQTQAFGRCLCYPYAFFSPASGRRTPSLFCSSSAYGHFQSVQSLTKFSLVFFYLASAAMAQGPHVLQSGRNECFASGLRWDRPCIPLSRAPSLHHRSAHELRKRTQKKLDGTNNLQLLKLRLSF